MPSTPKRRKAPRLLTSYISKASITTLNALAPLLFLWLSWNILLQDPIATLTAPLLPSIFILQTAFIILLLPLHNPVLTTKLSFKKRYSSLTLRDAIKSKAAVTYLSKMNGSDNLALDSISLPLNPRYSCILYYHHPIWSTINNTYFSNSSHCNSYRITIDISTFLFSLMQFREYSTIDHFGISY
jgi:hypothetical protein